MTDNIWATNPADYEVHPVADLFPMLADDELAELAEDIKQRGQLQPIVVDATGRIIDGRNRLAACALAGVPPLFETYEGDDPDGYALAVNVARRHLRPSQRYILIERARRLTGLTKSLIASSRAEVSRLTEAAIVLDFAPDLADAVVAGAMSLDTAAKTARQRKSDAALIAMKKDTLRQIAADLAEKVDDGQLDLDEALGAAEVRQHRAAQEAERQRAEEAARRALADRVAALSADLATRVTDGTLAIAEAESVMKERLERLATWAEKVRSGLATFARMAGNPMPVELKEHLSDDEIAKLHTILGALEIGESQ